MPRPACPRCAGDQSFRVERKGFFQNVVYLRLGRFPWKCADCNKQFLDKERGRKRSARSPISDPEILLPPTRDFTARHERI